MIALLCSAAVAFALAARGFFQGSLSPSGAAAAALVGFLHMASSFECGATLIAFYLTSSKLTKWRSELKARLEADHSMGGQRGASQVLANSLLGAALAVAAAWLRATSAPATPGGGGSGNDSGIFSTASTASTASAASLLTYAFVGFYACCCADTWSSEVGIASGSPPRLVTTGRRVPPGTNGGVSTLGTAAAAAGGAFVGCVYCLAARLPGLLLKLTSPSSGSGSGEGGAVAPCWRLILLALAAGVVGSLLDSLLGATLQWSGWDERSGKAVSGRPAGGGGGGVKHVCGRDVLSNTGVNVVSSMLATLLVAAVGQGWLGAGIGAQ